MRREKLTPLTVDGEGRKDMAVAELVERAQVLAVFIGRRKAAVYLTERGVRFRVIVRVISGGPTREVRKSTQKIGK